MKTIKHLALTLAFFAATTTVIAQNKKVNVEKSTLEWVGKKVTGQHNGTVNFSSGTLVFDGKKLKGGEFEVDMTTLTATDLTGGGKDKLNGHLKSDDFFGVEKFKTASLKFKTIADKGNGKYTITADLTIKGKTNPITFDMTISGNNATADLVIDRTKYDIKYGSGSFFDNLGDKAINDNFETKVKLVF